MRWVADQYEKEGRITNISDREMAEQVREHLPAAYEKAQKAGRFQYTHHEE